MRTIIVQFGACWPSLERGKAGTLSIGLGFCHVHIANFDLFASAQRVIADSRRMRAEIEDLKAELYDREARLTVVHRELARRGIAMDPTGTLHQACEQTAPTTPTVN